MHKILAGLFVALSLVAADPAFAQGCGPQNPNCIVPTMPDGNSTNRAASTAFVQRAVGAGITATAPITFSLSKVIGISLNGDFAVVSSALALSTTTVTPGTYGGALSIPSFTVDSKGRITAAGNNALGTMALQNASAVAITGGTITGMPTPTNATDVVNKSYVDSVAGGLTYLAPSRLATATVLPNSPTYSNGASGVGATLTAGSNGALSIDGVAVSASDVVLVKNQASAFQNGIYTVTTVGDGSNPYVLTRATYFDTSAEMLANHATLITAGNTLAGSAWMLQSTVTTVGTTAATFLQIGQQAGVVSIGGSTGVFTLGATLQTAGNVLSVVTGTSGSNIPLLSGANTWGGAQVFAGGLGGVTIGPGTGMSTPVIRGGNSGASDGASIFLQNAGVTVGAIGNTSAIVGGGYNANMMIYASGTLALSATGTTSCSFLSTNGSGVVSCGGILGYTTNVSGSGAQGIYNNLWYVYSDSAVSPPATNVQIIRTAAYTGGGISHALNVETTVNSGTPGIGEWPLIAKVNLSVPVTNSTTYPAATFQARRLAGSNGTGLMWGLVVEMNDETAVTSPSGTNVAVEIDNRGPGGNTDGSRHGIHIVAERDGSGGTGGTFTAGAGVLVGADGLNTGRWTYGLDFSGVFTSNVIRTTNAGVSSGVAIQMGNEHKIGFDASNSSYLWKQIAPPRLRYDVAGGMKFSVDDNGWIGGAGFNESAILKIGSLGAYKLTTGVDGSENIQFYVNDSLKKTFVINHPTRSDSYLVHVTLEGPEAAVFYRGKGRGGEEIALPDYFTALVDEATATVQLTPTSNGHEAVVCNARRVRDGRFRADCSVLGASFDWLVMAMRKDTPPLEVEPLKAKSLVRGDGPYRYIAGTAPARH